MATEVVAIIPARGGSRGIPRKNARPLAGRPLLAHTVLAAREAARVRRVIVSTDDPEIAGIAQWHGAEVVWRPAELSGDKASSESALMHVLDELESRESYRPELVVFLQCTSPMTTAEEIDGAIEKLISTGADSLLSVRDCHTFVWRETPEGAEGVNHDKSVRPMRQDREPQFAETGSIYVMRTAGLRQHRHRFFGRTETFVVGGGHGIEIDEPDDFDVVEMLVRRRDERRLTAAIRDAALRVRLFISDVDGVLTDSGMYYAEQGDELKKFNTRDGVGFELLREAGIATALVTSEMRELNMRRAAKLKIDHLRMGVRDKVACVGELIEELGLSFDQVCFIGDDRNDTPLLKRVGLPCCPADAIDVNRQASRVVTRAPGGAGCVRELAELLLMARS